MRGGERQQQALSAAMGDARDAPTHGNLGEAVGVVVAAVTVRVFSLALAPGWTAGGRRRPHPLNGMV
jgi:hypothetical protein